MEEQRNDGAGQGILAVIGGGPAGLLAAGRAAELGARVVLFDKNPEAGVKLLILERAGAITPMRNPTSSSSSRHTEKTDGSSTAR